MQFSRFRERCIVIAICCAVAFVLPNSIIAGGNVFSNANLTIQTMTVQKKVGTTWKAATQLVNGSQFRLQFDLINSAGGGTGYCVSGCTEWYYSQIYLEVKGSGGCYEFYQTDDFSGQGNTHIYSSEYSNAQIAGKELGRYARTRESLTIDVPFKWRCANTSVSKLSSDKQPTVTLFARQASPLNKKTSGPLKPSHKLVALGKTCSNNDDCVSNRCDRGMNTSNTKKCIPNDGKGKKGDYCTHPNHCDRWYYCAGSRKCSSLKGSGKSCTNNRECVGTCDRGFNTGNSNKCVPSGGLGTTNEYCTSNGHCKSGVCSKKKCTDQKKLGALCKGGNKQCESGRCDSGPFTSGTNRCIPNDGKGKPGDYCSHNNQCRRGYRCVHYSGNKGKCRK